jgi:hypothetical protein
MPLEAPVGPSGGDLGELISARLEYLKFQGKI